MCSWRKHLKPLILIELGVVISQLKDEKLAEEAKHFWCS